MTEVAGGAGQVDIITECIADREGVVCLLTTLRFYSRRLLCLEAGTTEKRHKTKYRKLKPEQNESPLQYIVWLRSYLSKWMTLTEINHTPSQAVQDVCQRTVLEYL